MQDGRDGDEEPGYIGNIQDGATAGFKYFDCRGVHEIAIKARGYGDGVFEIRTRWDGEVLGSIRYNIQMFGKNTVQRSAFRMECRQSISPIAEVET